VGTNKKAGLDELSELRLMLEERAPRLIGVDGMNDVGKTRRVARPLGLPIISGDCFLLGNGRYLGGHNYERLAEAIRDAMSRGQVVVEGCCLLAIAAHIGMTVDLHVYVRALKPDGTWRVADIGLGDDPERARSQHHAVASALGCEPDPVAMDLIDYHAKYRPVQNADIRVNLVVEA
jgi:hypothetical protein